MLALLSEWSLITVQITYSDTGVAAKSLAHIRQVWCGVQYSTRYWECWTCTQNNYRSM